MKFDRQTQAGEAGAIVTVRPVAEGKVLQLRQFPLESGREIVVLQAQAVEEAIFRGSEQTQAPDSRVVLQLQTK